jgi:ATP-dependent Clp protease ATP-binding subunit ClpC
MKTPDFVRSLGHDAELGLLQPTISRDEENAEILRILSSPEKANCVLLGPPGAGKSAIVEGIAYLIHSQKISPLQIYLVDLAAMSAGTMYRGMTEERAKKLIDFASSDKNIVLFIDEFHTLAGMGRTQDTGASSDVSQMLKPALARGTIRCIGATTEEEFNQYLQPDAAFVRRFQLVRIRSLEGEQLVSILKAKLSDLEARLMIRFDPDACTKIIQLAAKLFPTRAEPDRALDVLRRIGQRYETRRNLRQVASHTLEDALELLEVQRQLLTNKNLSRAAKQAKTWLGLDSVTLIVISPEELESHLVEIVSRIGA